MVRCGAYLDLALPATMAARGSGLWRDSPVGCREQVKCQGQYVGHVPTPRRACPMAVTAAPDSSEHCSRGVLMIVLRQHAIIVARRQGSTETKVGAKVEV